MRSLIPLALLALLHPAPSAAVRFPFSVRTDPVVRPRAANASAQTTEGISVKNTQNVQYIANISLGGSQFNVVLDTGSSDLWVAGTVPGTQDTGTSVSLNYAIGQAKGNINTAPLQFDNYTVDNQAYVLVTDTSTFSTDINSQGYQGLIGLGPNTGSVIREKLDSAAADSPLFRIFSQNLTASNYLTILLNRANDPGQTYKGEFTISEVVAGYENITSQTKLKIKDVPTLTDTDQHWAVFTDAYGFIGPDGNPIDYDSIVPRAPDNQLVAVLDSGFSYSQVPRDVADAIYGRVPSAEYDETSEIWTLPCDVELNITFKFGGVDFPIHPLDTVSNDIPTKDSAGNTVCIGAYQPITSAFSLLGEYDMILGMSFLRNAYALIDFGNFVTTSSNDQTDPFVQLLPLTHPPTAHSDFVQLRLSGSDTTSTQTLLPASQESHSPESTSEKKQQAEGAVLRNWPYILVGCLAFLIGLVAITLCACCRRMKRRRARESDGKMAMGQVSGSYQPLQNGQQWRHNGRV